MCEHPGKEIEKRLKTTGMTRKELATRTGVTEKHINTLISGERNITPSFAKKLGYVFHVDETGCEDPKENAKYWQGLQNNYDIFILEEREKNNITTEEIVVLDYLEDIVNYLIDIGKLSQNLTRIERILELRKMLQISDLSLIPKLPCKGAAFRAQLATNVRINRYVLFAWQYLCELTADTKIAKSELDLDLLKSRLNEIKHLMLNDLKNGCCKLKEIFATCGIIFNVVKHFRGAPVQGYIKKTDDNKLILCLTIRGGRADTFWFTLFHEIAHILNRDFESNPVDFDSSDSEIEIKADRWARDFLIPTEKYRTFIGLRRKPTWQEIEMFASDTDVQPYIVLGRLQKDGFLDWSDYASKMVHYKWAE
ncbi:MAG: helix-turn-helix domain-containing protein [Succinivibrionaceae bacterium]|nr:helix-turn-helix domain-containing protein [Succinivibrionaceae bacterium]